MLGVLVRLFVVKMYGASILAVSAIYLLGSESWWACDQTRPYVHEQRGVTSRNIRYLRAI
jgi:hypothetical protein